MNWPASTPELLKNRTEKDSYSRQEEPFSVLADLRVTKRQRDSDGDSEQLNKLNY